MKDPRLIEIELLAPIDAMTFSGSSQQYTKPNPMGGAERQEYEALYHLVMEGAVIVSMDYPSWGGGPTHPLDTAIQMTQRALEQGTARLRVTQRGRLRLFRLRDELLNRDRVREPFEVLWDARHWGPDLAVQLQFRQGEEPCSILLLDVDRLKAINTAMTHVGADDVLKSTFQILRAAVEPGQAYRLGGDEAGAILPGVGAIEVAQIAEKIRSTIESEFLSKPIDSAGHTPTVTIAVGTATSRVPPEQFRAQVDGLLVETKDRQGTRNVVVQTQVRG